MIEILELTDHDTVGMKLEGKVERSDILRFFRQLEKAAATSGKIKMYCEIGDFKVSDFSGEALKEDLKQWLKHPGLIPRIEKAALVTDVSWISTAFDIECAFIPTLSGRHFSFAKKQAALDWLRTDQRAASRLDLTCSEFVETATLKAAGGFAAGLLTARFLSERQRANIGKWVFLATIAAGIPLGLKVLNNNRRLLNFCRSHPGGSLRSSGIGES